MCESLCSFVSTFTLLLIPWTNCVHTTVQQVAGASLAGYLLHRRRSEINTMAGTTSHCSTGANPVPITGIVHMASTYCHRSKTEVANHSSIAVITSPMPRNPATRMLAGDLSQYRSLTVNETPVKATNAISTSPKAAVLHIMTPSIWFNAGNPSYQGICQNSQTKCRKKEATATSTSGYFSTAISRNTGRVSRAHLHNSEPRSRRALVITEIELALIAKAANIGLRSIPKTGYNTPAARGTPALL